MPLRIAFSKVGNLNHESPAMVVSTHETIVVDSALTEHHGIMPIFIVRYDGDVTRAAATIFLVVSLYCPVMAKDLGVPTIEPPSGTKIVDEPEIVL